MMWASRHINMSKVALSTLTLKTLRQFAIAVPVFLTSIGGYGISIERAIADELAVIPQQTRLFEHPLELHLLSPDADLSNRNVITNTMISQVELTHPSLWWADKQFGGKLLENWLAYPATDENPGRIDLIVDRQLWGLSTYLQRYTFVNQFGTVATDFGYSLRVFNDQGDPLASYACVPMIVEEVNFDAENDENIETNLSNLNCSVQLDSSGSSAFRGRSSTFTLF